MKSLTLTSENPAGQGRGSDACFARERTDDAGMHGFAAVRVSDGTRTRDRLDHNQGRRGPAGSDSALQSQISSSQSGQFRSNW
jgi:hypothetical protein